MFWGSGVGNKTRSKLVGWLVGFLTSSSTTRLYRGRAPRQERLTILRAATHETELGDHDFCLSRSHYTDTDPTSGERATTAGIEPGSSSPGVARSTAELPRPPQDQRDTSLVQTAVNLRSINRGVGTLLSVPPTDRPTSSILDHLPRFPPLHHSVLYSLGYSVSQRLTV